MLSQVRFKPTFRCYIFWMQIVDIYSKALRLNIPSKLVHMLVLTSMTLNIRHVN